MDITNPIITQWVVFAVHNLCEDNPENQAIIAAIDKKGTMDKSALRDLGIDIHNEFNDWWTEINHFSGL